MAQRYIHANMPAVFLAGLLDGMRRFYNNVDLSYIPFTFQLLGDLLHILLCHYFFTIKELGLPGIGLAYGLSNSFIYFSLCLHCHLHLPLVSRASSVLQNVCTLKEFYEQMKEYLEMGVPVAIMICCEWWAFEAILVMSGLLGVAA